MNVEVTVTLPSWKGYGSASACLKTSWNGMYKSLEAHENKHVSLGANVSAEVKRQVEAVSVSDASELQSAVDAAAQKVRDASNAVQEKFDNDTDHGRNDPTDPVKFAPC